MAYLTRKERSEMSRSVFSNAPEFKEGDHPRGDDGKFGPGTGNKYSKRDDLAVTNIPLSKRGDIDKQIDKYKAEQKKEKDSQDKKDFAKAKEQRQKEAEKGKNIFERHGEAVIDYYSKKTGKKKAEIRALIKEWAQYYPDRLEKAIAQMKPSENSAKVYRARK